MFCYLDSEDCSPFFRISPLCNLPFSTKHCPRWVLSPKRSYHIIFDYIPHCSIRININRQFFFFKSLCHKVSISFQEKFLQNTVEESRRIWEEYQQYFDLEIVLDDLENSFWTIMEAVVKLQNESQWVPLNWVYSWYS